MLSFVGIEKAATKGIHMTQYKLPLHMFISRLYFVAIAKFSIDIEFSVSILLYENCHQGLQDGHREFGLRIFTTHISFCEQNITPSIMTFHAFTPPNGQK